jgi:hypothetical protein
MMKKRRIELDEYRACELAFASFGQAVIVMYANIIEASWTEIARACLAVPMAPSNCGLCFRLSSADEIATTGQCNRYLEIMISVPVTTSLNKFGSMTCMKFRNRMMGHGSAHITALMFDIATARLYAEKL